MRKGLLTLFLLLSGISVFAQQSDWYVNKPIKDIRFTGIQKVSATELEGIIKPFIGQPLTDTILLDLQRRLYALEYFDYIEPDAEPADDTQSAVILTFKVSERATVEDISFKGNASMRASDIADAITSKVGDIVSKPKIAADEAAIQKLYLKDGYANVTVTSDLQPGKAKNSQKLVFTVDEGFKTSIRKIQFSGNHFASESTLKGLLKSAEQSLFNAGTFQEDNLDLDKDAILKYYRENGYVDAKVSDIQRSVDTVAKDKRNYLTLTYYVDEGSQWTFGGMTVSGNEIFTTQQLLALTKSKPGSVLNYTKVQADFQAISEQYYHNGYINNQINLNETRDDATKAISYNVSIDEHGRAYIENIVIRGANKTKTNVILRDLPFETGDVFSVDRIREGILNLNNEQFFSNIVPETPVGSEPGLFDLVLNLTERNTTGFNIGFSVTGSDSFPLAGYLKWSDSNFLGNGQNISAELNLGASEQKVVASFTDPWLFGPRWSGGISLSFDRIQQTGVLQDAIGPVFSSTDPNRVPDPYTGAYQFASDTTITSGPNAGTYHKGDYFPGVPSPNDISRYGLLTDYDYAGGASTVPSAYTMQYINTEIGLGLNTGKRFSTLLGWIGLYSSINVSLNYVDYDQTKYRPFDPELRANYQQFQFVNSLGFTASLDGRDLAYDPSNGYLISQGFTYTGGILLGSRNFIRSDSTVQAYLTLWNIPIGDTGAFKTVFALNSTLSVLFPQPSSFEPSVDRFAAAGYYLYTNPMLIARGWPSVTNGEVLLNNWAELRTPIVPQLLSFDIFFDAVRIMEDRGMILAPGNLGWMFTLGAGFRITNPSLPIRLYLGKRFDINNDGSVGWQKGNLFASDSDPTSGLDLIFTFSLN